MRSFTDVLSIVVNSTPQAIIASDLEGRVIAWNAAATGMFGWRAEEVLGRPVPTVPAGELAQELRRLRRGEKIACRSVTRYRRDGHTIECELCVSPMREGGEIVGVLATLVDVSAQRRTQAALVRDALLLASIQDCVIVTDTDGVVTYWNDGARRAFGWTAEEVLGRPLIAHCFAESADHLLALTRDVLAGRAFEGDLESRHKNGSRVWTSARISRITDDSGRVVGVMGVSRDITAHKRAEAERDHVNMRLRTQIDRTPLACLLFDAEMRLVDWNRAAERVFGYGKDEVLGMMPPYEPILPAAARRSTEDVLERLRAGDMMAHSINENLTKDGRTITCEWNNTPLFDASGAFSGILSLAQDVSERYRSERALRTSEERFRQITESISEVFWLRSLETGEIEYVSPAYERVWGRSREEMAADPQAWAAPIHDEDRERVLRAVFRQGSGGYDEEYRIVRPDGSVRWIRDRAFPVRAEDGRVVGIAGVAEDTTEQRTLEAQLRQAQKMEAMGQLSAGIAHDFNNLLTVIIGSSELLLESVEDAEGQRFLAMEIKRAGERSAALTRQLLAFSRQQVIAPRVLDVNEVVRDTETMLRRLIGEDVELVTALGGGVPAIKADPGQIEQLLLNLAVNARDAMPEGGRLTISTRALAASAGAGPQAVIAVGDSGCGMTDAVKRRLFEPFFTTKPPGKGTGLGLSVVHGVVKQNNGRIEVASAPGRGTTFTILLPGNGPAAGRAAEAVAGTAAAGAASGTILLVEDDDSLRRLTRRTLERTGYRVLEARCGSEAIALAETGPVDLLMTDLHMPGMSGRDVAARITARHPALRVLFVSGYAADALPHAAFPAEAVLGGGDRAQGPGGAGGRGLTAQTSV